MDIVNIVRMVADKMEWSVNGVNSAGSKHEVGSQGHSSVVNVNKKL